jgi:Reverse transcriptase (RNA-dependent DNA polymerase)
VINDATFRLALLIQRILKLKARLADVKVAFLHGDLDEEIYMNCPPGFEHEPDECVLLLNGLYGLVQVACQFCHKFTAIMKSIGFKQNPAEPCMLFKKEDTNLTVAVIHVDNCYLIGSDASLNDLVMKLEANGLKIKVELDAKDYLGYEILVDKGKKRAWLGQPHIVKKMMTRFADIIGISKLKYKTPGTPGFNIICPSNPDEQISQEDQVIYHAGVGTLLYLIKYSRPYIANVVRELSNG